MFGASQYSAASRKPAPNHQPRTAASQAGGRGPDEQQTGHQPAPAEKFQVQRGEGEDGQRPAASAAYRDGWERARHSRRRLVAMTSIVALPGPGRAAAAGHCPGWPVVARPRSG